jgi:hypothetical protein
MCPPSSSSVFAVTQQPGKGMKKEAFRFLDSAHSESSIGSIYNPQVTNMTNKTDSIC